jgi:hypothetical protein
MPSICVGCRAVFDDESKLVFKNFGPGDPRNGNYHFPQCPIYFSRPSSDPINPSHYKGDYVMRIIEDFSLDFLDGQVIKYMLRSGKKDGAPATDDYKKALWYLQRKISNTSKT